MWYKKISTMKKIYYLGNDTNKIKTTTNYKFDEDMIDFDVPPPNARYLYQALGYPVPTENGKNISPKLNVHKNH